MRTGDPDDVEAPDVEAPELLDLPIGDEIEASDVGQGDVDDAGRPPAQIPIEAFRQGLASVFAISGQAAGLDTLRQAPARQEFPPAADCLYQLALETPWLRFLVEPESLFVQRLLIIGAFAAPVGLGCMAELRAKRESAVKADGGKPPTSEPTMPQAPPRPPDPAPPAPAPDSDL